jgi:hypothetical protein
MVACLHFYLVTTIIGSSFFRTDVNTTSSTTYPQQESEANNAMGNNVMSHDVVQDSFHSVVDQSPVNVSFENSSSMSPSSSAELGVKNDFEYTVGRIRDNDDVLVPKAIIAYGKSEETRQYYLPSWFFCLLIIFFFIEMVHTFCVNLYGMSLIIYC